MEGATTIALDTLILVVRYGVFAPQQNEAGD
jgi:hypothetical protein